MKGKLLFILVFLTIISCSFTLASNKSGLVDYSIDTILLMKDSILQTSNRANQETSPGYTFVLTGCAIDLIPAPPVLDSSIYGKIAWAAATTVLDMSMQSQARYTFNETGFGGIPIFLDNKYFWSFYGKD